ncbi:hypothetical protein ACH5RR_009282 [Cinchona calisaya]|uniref:Uncharacterized protein n=1 Tax=Cinchona calisaya TaxID=153742 RepID=A0ABD3AH56_9GENT
MSFCSKWIGLITRCFSTVSYSFKFNRNVCGYIRPTRRIRRGDPLSPYLFPLGSERLNSLLSQVTLEKDISGTSICRRVFVFLIFCLLMIHCSSVKLVLRRCQYFCYSS